MILLSDSVALGQTKYTERFKNAAEYRQAWIASILGEDESHGMFKHALIPQVVCWFFFSSSSLLLLLLLLSLLLLLLFVHFLINYFQS